MRILVTNDDGVHAQGIAVLERVARTICDDVWVVAPETNQSGAAHSLTLTRPLRVKQLGDRRYTVDGTPTDCVMLALQHILPEGPEGKVDFVLSGINHGGNLGEDVTYSGTVAAAMEATLFKIPAIALSQVCEHRHDVRWATAERWAPEVLAKLTAMTWPPDVLINVNIPDLPGAEIKGVQVTGQGKRKIGDTLIERKDPRGEPYIWIGAIRESDEAPAGTDLAAINDGFIAVTPVHLDMTHYPSRAALQRLFEN